MSDELPPPYDPASHSVEDNPMVSVELYCVCGGVFRQIDPVDHVLFQIEDFRVKHSGKGHGVTDGKKALVERELRREAAFRAAGRQSEYKAKKHAPGGVGFDWSKG